MSDIQRFDTGPRMSEMSVYNGVAYLAGQVAADATQDAQGQTADVLAQIDALLARAGTDKSRILIAQIFLADLADFPAMNLAWEAWVAAGNAPARATVEAKLAKPEWKVEIVGKRVARCDPFPGIRARATPRPRGPRARSPQRRR
jgi:enamine deaminase RidA (YjgF/YER057c/UK114 family)